MKQYIMMAVLMIQLSGCIWADNLPTANVPSAPVNVPVVTRTYASIIQIGRGIGITANEIVAGSLIAVGAPVRIDGVVSGNVVLFGDPAAVNNRLEGNLILFGGSARIRSGAQVLGSVYCLGGEVIVDPGAKITGRMVIEKPQLYYGIGQMLVRPDSVLVSLYNDFFRPSQDFFLWILCLVFVLLWCMVLVGGILTQLIFSRNVRNIERSMVSSPALAVMTGILAIVFIKLLVLLMILSVVGLVFVPFMLIAVVYIILWSAVICGKKLLDSLLTGLGIYDVSGLILFILSFILVSILSAVPYLNWAGIPLTALAGLSGLGGLVRSHFGNLKIRKK